MAKVGTLLVCNIDCTWSRFTCLWFQQLQTVSKIHPVWLWRYRQARQGEWSMGKIQEGQGLHIESGLQLLKTIKITKYHYREQFMFQMVYNASHQCAHKSGRKTCMVCCIAVLELFHIWVDQLIVSSMLLVECMHFITTLLLRCWILGKLI